MTFYGAGDQDWVELDLEAFDRDTAAGLEAVVEANRSALAQVLGDGFTVEPALDGGVWLVGERRYRARVDRAGRLELTGDPDPDGPL